jgi:hypothetical protein
VKEIRNDIVQKFGKNKNSLIETPDISEDEEEEEMKKEIPIERPDVVLKNKRNNNLIQDVDFSKLSPGLILYHYLHIFFCLNQLEKFIFYVQI